MTIVLSDSDARQPHFFAALLADAKFAAAARGELSTYRNRLHALLHAVRLMWVNDASLALACYRAQARLDALGVPLLPRLARRLAMLTAQVSIGRAVVIEPGVHLGHGQVTIEGLVEIEHGVVILPWVTIGSRDGNQRGPTIEQDVRIGTGAIVLGGITVHRGARIGANAVVTEDVPARATAIGVPARLVGETR